MHLGLGLGLTGFGTKGGVADAADGSSVSATTLTARDGQTIIARDGSTIVGR